VLMGIAASLRLWMSVSLSRIQPSCTEVRQKWQYQYPQTEPLVVCPESFESCAFFPRRSQGEAADGSPLSKAMQYNLDHPLLLSCNWPQAGFELTGQLPRPRPCCKDVPSASRNWQFSASSQRGRWNHPQKFETIMYSIVERNTLCQLDGTHFYGPRSGELRAPNGGGVVLTDDCKRERGTRLTRAGQGAFVERPLLTRSTVS
jgi:hypothetical protein